MEFSDSELRLYRYTLNVAAVVALTGLIILIIWVLAYVASLFTNLILPLAIAGVLAMVLQPIVDIAERRLHLGRTWAVTLLFVGFFGAVASVLVYTGPTITRQIAYLSRSFPFLIDRFGRWISETFPAASDAGERVIEALAAEDLFGEVQNVGDYIVSYTGLVVGLGFIPLYLFFFLLLGNRIGSYFKESLSVTTPDTRDDIVYLGEVFKYYVTAFFQGQLIIAILMGIMFAVGFSLIGLSGSIIIGILLGALNIVPFLGTIVGILIVTPLALLQEGGGLTLLALSGLVFLIVQLVESWILTPKIMGDRSGLHPLVVVISIFFWGIALNGIIGMILAVPLTAFVIALWRHVRIRFLSPVVSDTHYWEEGGIIEHPERPDH